jgi:hypothetical protein
VATITTRVTFRTVEWPPIYSRPIVPTVYFRLDVPPQPQGWLDATLIRWGLMEPRVDPMRRVAVIFSHGFAETAVFAGETELGRFTDAAMLRRGVNFVLPDQTTLRATLMGTQLVVTRNGQPLARIGDPRPSVNFGVDFLYFSALFYGVPGLIFLFMHVPGLGLGGWNIVTGVVLAAIASWASRKPLPALWIGAATILVRTAFELQNVGSPTFATAQWRPPLGVSIAATLIAFALLVPVVRAAVVATLAQMREA